MGSKNNLKAWFLFIVIIFAAFFALIYLRDSSKESPITSQKTPSTSSEEEEESGPGKEFTTRELTPQEKAEMDSSALNKAIVTGDINDCDGVIYDEEMRKRCMDNVNYGNIIDTGDEKGCSNIFNEPLRQQCYEKIYFMAAIDGLDLSLCEKIETESARLNCTNQIQVVLGRTAQNEEGCNSITNTVLKEECLNNFYFSKSVEELESENCSNITNPLLEERCNKSIAQNIKIVEASKKLAAAPPPPPSTTDILERCNNLPEDQAASCKDKANFTLAFERKDLSYCSRITSNTEKQNCIKEQTEKLDQFYLRQAIATRTDSLCSKIINTALQQLCSESA